MLKSSKVDLVFRNCPFLNVLSSDKMYDVFLLAVTVTNGTLVFKTALTATPPTGSSLKDVTSITVRQSEPEKIWNWVKKRIWSVKNLSLTIRQMLHQN